MSTWMVVEDEPDIYEVLLAMFEVWGIDGESFVDGGDAVAWIDDVDDGRVPDDLPELAIIDVRLPEIPGQQVSARLRRSPVFKNMAIVLVTAYMLHPQEEDEIMAESGADMILYKPLPGPTEFREMLESVLAKRTALAEEAEEAAKLSVESEEADETPEDEPSMPEQPESAAAAEDAVKSSELSEVLDQFLFDPLEELADDLDETLSSEGAAEALEESGLAEMQDSLMDSEMDTAPAKPPEPPELPESVEYLDLPASMDDTDSQADGRVKPAVESEVDDS